MGLTSFQGGKPRKDEVLVAKNYLTADELNILNRITTAYLEFAELQALRHHHMYMKDWIAKLDDFIKMSGSELLQYPGKISKLEADNKALAEYAKYQERTKTQLSAVEKEFLESLGEIQKNWPKRKRNSFLVWLYPLIRNGSGWSKHNFWNLYKDFTDHWVLYYNGRYDIVLVGKRDKGQQVEVLAENLYTVFQRNL